MAGRLAAAVALLVLAAAGARAREHTRLGTKGIVGAGANTVIDIMAFALVAAACVVLAGLVVVLARRKRRRDDEFTVAP